MVARVVMRYSAATGAGRQPRVFDGSTCHDALLRGVKRGQQRGTQSAPTTHSSQAGSKHANPRDAMPVGMGGGGNIHFFLAHSSLDELSSKLRQRLVTLRR